MTPVDLTRLQQLIGQRPFEPFDELKVAQYFSRKLRDRWVAGCRLIRTRKVHGRWKWQLEIKDVDHCEEAPL